MGNNGEKLQLQSNRTISFIICHLLSYLLLFSKLHFKMPCHPTAPSRSRTSDQLVSPQPKTNVFQLNLLFLDQQVN